LSQPNASSGPLTRGVSHVGLAVSDIQAARSFFVDGLGYQLLGDDPAYPASFVTDGGTMLTLWQVEDPATATAFDRRRNIGLHHLALAVPTERLESVFERVSAWPGVEVEFAPARSLRGGDASHFMIAMPGGGARIEFVCSPALPGH